MCALCHSSIERRPSQMKNSKHGLYFCSRAHKEQAQTLEAGQPLLQPSHYNNGVSNYRVRALRKNQICVRCCYDRDLRMLDVDHIDSDRKNNAIGNLQVLCVWCHALKTRGVPEHERR
jgi:hypothetical protein